MELKRNCTQSERDKIGFAALTCGVDPVQAVTSGTGLKPAAESHAFLRVVGFQ